jgi:hypothetical protein
MGFEAQKFSKTFANSFEGIWGDGGSGVVWDGRPRGRFAPRTPRGYLETENVWGSAGC